MHQQLANKFDQQFIHLIDETERETTHKMKQVDEIAEFNQYRVIEAFRKQQVSDAHLHGTTGYGYDDFARDTLEAVYADVFNTEDAIVRQQLVSGTHAITTALFGVLKPGDELLYITGKPYDTMEEIIGLRGESPSSMKAYGISCRQIELMDDDTIDLPKVLEAIEPKTKVVAIQRSCGYEARASLTVEEIGKAISAIKNINKDVIIFVDNCYGEFVETEEPTHAGADLMAGSLIKNPGGGLAKTGGYIAGKKSLIQLCAERLTAPGLGKEVGPAMAGIDLMYQGFFLAPHVVGQAVKGAVFTAALLSNFGFKAKPEWDEDRTDIVQQVSFPTKEELVAFIQTVQRFSPVNAHVTPYPDAMPGYEDPVIMAAGTFIQGSSIELSADAPIRKPYTAYVQGGLTYEHVKTAVIQAVNEVQAHQK